MRVLLIENETKLRDTLTDSLKEACYAVDVAENSQKGVLLARTNDYDLIIFDHAAQQEAGCALCQELRGAGITTPILVLSTLSETVAKVELLNAGADDCLTKPFSFQELNARARALIRRQSPPQPNTLTAGDLTLDTIKLTVTRGNKHIELTRKEFMLLEYLMRNEGAVASRTAIMEHVWDMHADPFSNTIETHIATLRHKIEAEGTPHLIHTVPGRGYRLESSCPCEKSAT